MTNQAARTDIHRKLETRDRHDQAAREGAARRGTQGLDINARLLRLSSRYNSHKAAGRVQAAAAVKRMARRLAEQLPE